MAHTAVKAGIWQKYSKAYKSLWMILLYSLVLSALMFLLNSTGIFGGLEQKSLDLRFRMSPAVALADTNVVLIAIDQGSLDYIQEYGQSWPFPRSYYGLITRYLNSQNPKAIIYDILFDNPDFYRGDEDPRYSDMEFAEAMSQSPKTVLGFTVAEYSSEIPEATYQHAWKVSKPQLNPYPGADLPIPLFIQSAAALGGISMAKDSDATLRSVPLYYNVAGKIYPNLGLAAIGLATGRRDFSLPEAKNRDFYLRWYGKGGIDGAFHYIPFSELMYSAVQSESGGSGTLPAQLFRDKYVIIGATASGLMDLKSSPYTWGMPGMETWATFISNVINKHFIVFPGALFRFFSLLFISILVLLSVLRLSSMQSLMANLSITLVLMGITWLLFASFSFAVEFSPLVATLLLSWLLGLTISFSMEGKHKREMRMIFNRYLHPDLVDRIVANPNQVAMGGEELEVTVMFSDIYDFTGFSEKHLPQELVSYLNEYFGSFTNSILDHHGLLDKYTGDGLMAVFGAPLARKDHALCACRAAVAHRKMALDFANRQNLSASEYFHLNTRLGINSGSVVSGNIGSSRRMEYTSIGDAVNLAARLEGVNKIYGTHIIISESTWQDVKDLMHCRELDTLKVKGKKTGTRIFELLGEKGNILPFEEHDVYAEGLELYRQGDFAAAKAIFAKIPEDSAAITMLERCTLLLKNPPEAWDGIYTLNEK